MAPLFLVWQGTDGSQELTGIAIVRFDQPLATGDDFAELKRRLIACDGITPDAVIMNWRRMEDPA